MFLCILNIQIFYFKNLVSTNPSFNNKMNTITATTKNSGTDKSINDNNDKKIENNLNKSENSIRNNLTTIASASQQESNSNNVMIIDENDRVIRMYLHFLNRFIL